MSVAKNSLIYLGSSVLNKSLPLLLLPLLTLYLTPSEYGMLSIFQIFVTFFLAFIGMAMQTNVASQFYEKSTVDIAILIGNIFLILTFNVMLMLMVTGVVYYWLGIKSIFTLPWQVVLIAVFIAALTMLIEVYTTVLRCRSEALQYGKVEVFFAIVRALLIVFFLLVFNQGWFSQVYGMLFSSIIVGVYAFVTLKKTAYVTFVWDLSIIRAVLKLSLPLIPHIIGGVVIAMSDRLFIERMVDLKTVGIYSVGYTFGMIIMLFIDAFIKAWSPWFYKKLTSPTEKGKKAVVKYIYIYILSVFCFSVIFALLAELLLPYIVDAAFGDARQYILWVSIGYAMQGVYKIFFPFLVHLKKTHFLAITTVIAALINLLLNYYLIAIYGAIGAAYATVIAFLVSAILVFLIQKHYYEMPWLKR